MKLNRKVIRRLIKEELSLIAEASNELRALKEKAAMLTKQMNDHVLDMGGENEAYAYGYLGPMETELSSIYSKIYQIESQPEQLALPLEYDEQSSEDLAPDQHDSYMEYVRMNARDPDEDRNY